MQNKLLSFTFILSLLLSNQLKAQGPMCPYVNNVPFTQQAGFGNYNRIIIGGFGTNDATICWNCYNDSSTYGVSKAYNLPSMGFPIGSNVPHFSSRITQDPTSAVLRIQNGVGACYSDITWQRGISLLRNGSVGIGTDQTFGALLAVNGMIYTKSDIEVNPGHAWPDYVFLPTYKLPSIADYEKQVRSLGYIPQIGSSSQLQHNGHKLGEMQTRQMEVIEMMLLYQFEMNKRLDSLEKVNAELEKKITTNATDSIYIKATQLRARLQNPDTEASKKEEVKKMLLEILNECMKPETE